MFQFLKRNVNWKSFLFFGSDKEDSMVVACSERPNPTCGFWEFWIKEKKKMRSFKIKNLKKEVYKKKDSEDLRILRDSSMKTE